MKMSRVLHLTAALAVLALPLGGCAGKNSGDGDGGRLEYRLVRASEKSPPTWINQPPDDAGGMHFMVGLSGHHADDVGAREAAMRSARGEYARYTGVEVNDIDAIERFLNTRESAVADAQVKGRLASEQKTNALVSRIKAKNWYIETFDVLRDGVAVDTAYKAAVLVTIPVDEDKKVAEWKQSLKADAAAGEEKAERAAEAAVQGVESQIRTALAEVDQLAAGGHVLQAFALLGSETGRLADERARLAAGDERIKKKIYRIDALQQDIQRRTNALVHNLQVDSGRFRTVYVDANLPGQTLPGWAWYRSGNTLLPVSGMPLRVVAPSGQVAARGITNATGRADFVTSGFDTAGYRLELDIEHPVLAPVQSVLKANLASCSCNLSVVKTGNDIAGATNYAVTQLFAGSQYKPLPAQKLFMGPVTYAETGVSSSFSSQVQRYLKQSLTGIDGLTVVPPRKRDVENVKEAVRTRGIAMVEKNPAAASLGDAATQAVIDGAEAALVAQYEVQPDGVLLDLSLKQAGSDVLLAAATARIAREAIPHGTELVPPTDAPVKPAPKASGGALRVDISTHLGNGQTFQEGDVVSYFARLDQAAYLLLVYEDAEGNLIQIFPNRYADNRIFPAGTTIEVPGKNENFEFEITAPFGHERVYAFAATRAFSPPAGSRLENGLTLFNCSRDELFKTLRAVTRTAGVAYGEASTVLTTVPKTY